MNILYRIFILVWINLIYSEPLSITGKKQGLKDLSVSELSLANGQLAALSKSNEIYIWNKNYQKWTDLSHIYNPNKKIAIAMDGNYSHLALAFNNVIKIWSGKKTKPRVMNLSAFFALPISKFLISCNSL